LEGLVVDERIIIKLVLKYSRTPPLRVNWDSEPSGNAENPDNWIFL